MRKILFISCLLIFNLVIYAQSTNDPSIINESFHPPNDDIHTLVSLITDHHGQIDVNRTGKDGMTALHLVSELGENLLISLFVDAGANINKKNHKGNTPLLHLICNQNLLTQDQIMNTFITLLENGADINDQNNKGETVAHCMIDTHQEYLLSVLFTKYKIDLSIRDDQGRSIQSILTPDINQQKSTQSILISE